MKTEIVRVWLGWTLLVIAFFIGCLTIYWEAFVDEADNLVVGWLLTERYVLYRDIFSHHFPFPYYWSAVIVSLFGKSIFTVRLSVWLFQIISLGAAMRLSGYHLLLGLAALIWGILRHLYFGNMVLYSSFSGVSLAIVFIVTLAVIQQQININWRHMFAIGVFSLISIFSDPLSIYAIVVALVCLLINDVKYGVLTTLPQDFLVILPSCSFRELSRIFSELPLFLTHKYMPSTPTLILFGLESCGIWR